MQRKNVNQNKMRNLEKVIVSFGYDNGQTYMQLNRTLGAAKKHKKYCFHPYRIGRFKKIGNSTLYRFEPEIQNGEVEKGVHTDHTIEEELFIKLLKDYPKKI